MELELVNFEQAKALKELGFNYKCQGYYDLVGTLYPYESAMHWNHNANTEHKSCYSAPTLELAAKWFRDERNLIITVFYDDESDSANPDDEYESRGWYYLVEEPLYQYSKLAYYSEDYFDTYEEALSAGINKVIKILTIED